MVAPDTEVEGILRYPEVREDHILVILIPWREYQHEGRDIRSGGQVKTAVADAAFEVVFIHGISACIPFIHWHPADGLLYPLIEAQLSKGVLLAGILLCRLAGGFHLIDADRDTQRRIRLFPNLWISPVLVRLRAIDNRIEGWIDLPAIKDVLRFLVDFIADCVCIVSGSGNQEI